MSVAGLLFQPAIAQENLASSGNYRIRYCGKGPGSKAAQLQALLPKFWAQLQLVLADVKRGTASKAYSAYFKSQDNATYVQSVFQAIADGALVQIPVDGAPSHFSSSVLPSIICVDPSVPNVDSLLSTCNHVAAAIVPNREIVILCDHFWTQMADRPLPVRSDCPRVRHNKFVPDDYRVMYNQFGTFVHEFAHAYIRVWNPDNTETYNPTAAVNLSAERSLLNANNYALYASSVIANCSRYVSPPVIVADDDRELLEISEGETSTVDIGPSWSSIAAAEAAEAAGLLDPEPDPLMPTNPPLIALLENGMVPASIGDVLPPVES
ncbi:MAG: hypothetical protein Q9207_006310 [Kuettlingeria erythrocarpa]